MTYVRAMPDAGSENHIATWADKALLVVLGIVGVYSAALVLVGGRVDDRLFEPLGFGLPDDVSAVSADHATLLRGILGAVILGWTVLIAAIARFPLRAREPWSWHAIVASLSVWFVVDTSFSVAISQWEHALFNVGFAVALCVPLASIRTEIGGDQ